MTKEKRRIRSDLLKSARSMFVKTREIDRGLGRQFERMSRFLWPWQERWLLLLIVSLVFCDFASTYALLELSGKRNVYEAGFLAGWALRTGGFAFLFLIDVLAAVVLIFAAFAARYLYARRGFRDYARAAFVFLLLPYIVIATIAIANNLILLSR